MNSRCKHFYCRCMRANELARMGRAEAALEVHYDTVVCRLPKEDRKWERLRMRRSARRIH